MKGVFIFNHLNDVSYMQVDEEYSFHLNTAATADLQISSDNGEICLADSTKVNDDTTRPLPLTPDVNVILQLFAPLLASQRFMAAQMAESYKTITCENGFLFCVQQFGEDVYIAVNGDGSETEMFLQHKLRMLKNIYRFLFGTIITSARPEVSTVREERWRYVGQLLTSWAMLYAQEQAFLWRAVERLQINAALNAHCVSLLESAVEAMRAAGATYPVHAVLMVDAKLLALYSSHSASELSANDIQLIAILVNSSDLMDGQRKGGQSESDASQPQSKDTNVESHPTSTELKSPSDLPSGGVEGACCLDPGNGSSRTAVTLDEGLPHYMVSTESADGDFDPACCNASEASHSEYHSMNVFLWGDVCPVNPHRLYIIPVLPSMVLVVICQLSRTSHAAVLYDTIARIVHILQSEGSTVQSTCQQHIAAISSNICKLHTLHKRFKKSSEVRQIISAISSKWEVIKKSGFGSASNPTTSTALTPRQESLLLSLRASHEHLFSLFYCRPRRLLPETRVNIAQGVEIVHTMLQRCLVDYNEFLTVKAHANVTMTAYEELFPNLVFFSYINRTTGQIVAPSVNTLQQHHRERLVGEKIWRKVQWIERRQEDGYSSMIIRDGDYVYSYFCWLDHMPRLHAFSKSGLLSDASNDFSSICECTEEHRLKKEPRYELFSVHDGNVPDAAYILDQCRRLSARLWEMSTSSSFHFSLF